MQVVTCTDRAVAAGPKSPRNLDQAKLLIQNLQATQQSTDFLGGLTEAVAALGRAEGPTKEVYLFSDMQRGGWERQSSAVRVKCEEIKAQGTLFLVRCGTQPVRERRRRRPEAAGGHPAHRQPDAVHRPRQEHRHRAGHRADRHAQGRRPAARQGRPADREARARARRKPVTLTGKIDQAGWRVLTAEVKPDQLDDDNRFDRVILRPREGARAGRGRLAERARPGEGGQLLPRPRPVAGAGRVQVPVPRPADGREGRRRLARATWPTRKCASW